MRLVEDDGISVQRDFLLTPLPSSENIYVGTTSSSTTLTPRVIPEALSTAVQENSGVQWQSIALPGDGADRPGLAFGTKVTLPPGREYALYLVYDLCRCRIRSTSSTALWPCRRAAADLTAASPGM